MGQPWACASQTSSMGNEHDQRPQLLCFEIHFLACAKVTPRQWLSIGGWGRYIPGRQRTLLATNFGLVSPMALLHFFDCTTVYNTSMQPSLPLSFTWDQTYIMIWWISQFFFYSLPIFFHTNISPNIILACLVLSLYLLLRGPELIQDGIVFFIIYEVILCFSPKTIVPMQDWLNWEFF